MFVWLQWEQDFSYCLYFCITHKKIMKMESRHKQTLFRGSNLLSFQLHSSSAIDNMITHATYLIFFTQCFQSLQFLIWVFRRITEALEQPGRSWKIKTANQRITIFPVFLFLILLFLKGSFMLWFSILSYTSLQDLHKFRPLNIM